MLEDLLQSANTPPSHSDISDVGVSVGLGVGDGVGLGVGDGVGLGVGDGVGLWSWSW